MKDFVKVFWAMLILLSTVVVVCVGAGMIWGLISKMFMFGYSIFISIVTP